MKNIRLLIYSLFACSMLLVSACSDAFKAKLAAGMAVAEYFGSSNVVVGTAMRSSADKGSRSLITVTIKDVKWQDYDEKELEVLTCLAAYDFMKKLAAGEAKNDQYIGVDLEDAMNGTKEFEYKVADLLALDGAISISTQFYEAYKSGSVPGLNAVIDQTSIDSSAVNEMTALSTELNNEFGGNGQRKMAIRGLNVDEEMETGEKTWQVLLTEQSKDLVHRYLVNVDKKTRKIIGVSYNTRKP